MEVNTIFLENNKSYIIMDTIINGDNKYLVLFGEDDNTDIVLRKVIVKENKEYLVKLDSEDEFDEVITIFSEKHTKGEEKDEK